MTTILALGPPEVLWFDVRVDKKDPKSMTVLEHWTGRSPHTILRDFYPAGLAVYERERRRFIFHSEYLAFLRATSQLKQLLPDRPAEGERFTRDPRGRIAAKRRDR